MDEVKLELTEFRSFRDFFIRELKEGARPQMDEGRDDALTSPCDGCIVKAEQVKEGKIEAVKGKAYSMTEFLFGMDDLTADLRAQALQQPLLPLLSTDASKNKNTKLMYTVIYLSPKNYHRFHAPAALFQIESRRHIEGFLELVRPSYLAKHPRVLQTSERVNLFGSWGQGRFIYSAVGALNVGSINLQFEPDFLSNKWKAKWPFAHDMDYSRVLSTSLTSSFAPALRPGSVKFKQYDSKVVVSEQDQLEFDVKDMLSLHPQAEQRPGSLPGESLYVLEYSPLLEESLRYNANNLFKSSKSEQLSFLEKLQEGEKLKQGLKDYQISDKGILVKRGQPVGYFNFGSTIVLVFQAKKEWEFTVKEGDPIKMGELLGRNK